MNMAVETFLALLVCLALLVASVASIFIGAHLNFNIWGTVAAQWGLLALALCLYGGTLLYDKLSGNYDL